MLKFFVRLFFLFPLLPTPYAFAIEDRADIVPNDPIKSDRSVAWKATFGRYKNTLDGYANDVNLRGNSTANAFWLGSYSDEHGFTQSRGGAENTTEISYGRLITSLQIASGGFAGSSVTWDAKREGDSGFSPLVGIGRTNTKPYYNLNFDPNDSVLWGGTFSQPQLGLITLYQIYDDRLNTGQRVTHLVWRRDLPNAQRLTLDFFSRKGASDAGQPFVHGNGCAATVDFEEYFLKIAFDQKANFTDGNITRLSVGFRF